jgi:PleD family two-component response regulator
MRNKVESIRLRQKDSTAINNSLSLSVGVTQMREEDTNESILRRAIKSQEKASQTGSNKVVVG